MTLAKFVLNDIIFPLTGAMAGAAICYGAIRYSNRPGPAYVLEINRDLTYPVSGSVTLNYIHRTAPNIQNFDHKSLSCLQERGYEITVTDHTDYRNNLTRYTLKPTDDSWIQHTPYTPPHTATEMLRVFKKGTSLELFDIDEFLRHCKECGTHTEVRRIETPKRDSKDLLPTQHLDRHYWHKCYVDRTKL